MAKTLQELFTGNVQLCSEYSELNDAKLIYEGGKPLADKLVTISDDETQSGGSTATINEMRQESVTETSQSVDDSYARRKELYVDRVNISQMLEDQRAYLSMPKWNIAVEGNEELQEIVDENTDGDGKSMLDFVLDMSVKAMAYRHCFAIVDREALMAQEISVAEAEDFEKPYAYIIDPTNIAVTYKTRRNAEIETAIIRSYEVVEWEDQDGVKFPKDAEEVYTLWTSNIIRKENAKGEPIGEPIVNPIGSVPIIEMEMPNNSLIYGMKSEVQACNFLFSLSVSSMRTAVYGLLVLFTDSAIKDIGTGNGLGIRLSPGDKAEAINTPTDATNEAKIRSNDVLEGIREKFRNRQRTNSREVITQSGESKKQDMVAEEAFLRQMSKIIEKAIIELVDTFQLYYGGGEVETTVSVPDAFMRTNLSDELAKAKHLEESYSPVDKYAWAAQKREARRLSVERSMSPEEINLSDAEIESIAEERFGDIIVSEGQPEIPELPGISE